MCHPKKIVNLTTVVVVREYVKDQPHLLDELCKFGLSVQQAKIYLLLVEHKELRIQEIVSLASMPRSSVYEHLRRLFELGIAEEIVEDSFKKIRPYSVGVMRHGLDEEMLHMQRLKQDLHTLEQTIKIPENLGTDQSTTVKYYKNRSGARQLYWNTLRAKNTVYVFSDWGRGRYVGMRFYENFVAESRSRNIQERVLINPSEETLASIREFTFPGSHISRTRLEDIRAIDEQRLAIKGDTLMYNNVYAEIYLKNVEINGFEIASTMFTDMQRAIFEILWEDAQPVATLLA